MCGRYCFCLHKELLRKKKKKKEYRIDVNVEMLVLYVCYYSAAVIEKYKAQLSDQSSDKVTDALLIFHSARPHYKQEVLLNDYRQVKRIKSC